MPAFRYHSIEPEGVWTSEPFPSAERRHIVQGVIAGFLSGHPRWATDLEGNFIYGLDAKGKEMKSAPKSGHATIKGSAFDPHEAAEHVLRPNARFSTLASGETFRFPGTQIVHTKLSGPWYRDGSSGHRFKTGAATAVVPVGGHGRQHATKKKSAAELDREIAEALGRLPYDDPQIQAKWRVEPSELRVGMRFDYFGKPYEITKIGRDKAKTIQIARRYKDPFGKEELIDHRSFPMRAFYQQHLRPLRG